VSGTVIHSMIISSFLRSAAVALVLLLSGCAANKLHGYQNTYQGYAVPQPLLQSIESKFRQHGLAGARITRDLVGRVQLAGSYRNEDEVDTAFVIVQSIVGLKSTSPFYPVDIRERRAEREARAGLNAALNNARNNAPPRRIALVIGINEFRDSRISPVPGEDDAIVAAHVAGKAGYAVTSLLGKAATKAAIESTLQRIEEDLRPQDSLFIYISSHGAAPLPSSRGGDQRRMSIVAWDTIASHGVDATDGQVQLQKTSVSDALVQRLAPDQEHAHPHRHVLQRRHAARFPGPERRLYPQDQRRGERARRHFHGSLDRSGIYEQGHPLRERPAGAARRHAGRAAHACGDPTG